jgi:hypothetical protein
MLSQSQADVLTSHFDRIMLMLDGDAAGQQGTVAIMNLLARQMPVAVVQLRGVNNPINSWHERYNTHPTVTGRSRR